MVRPVSRQVVLVTGASSGLGRATALAFARAGAAVVLVARRAEALEELAREIEHGGGRALAAPADVTVDAEVERAAAAAVDRFGRIDTWVLCAAVFVHGLVDDVTIEEYRRVLDVNVLGYIRGAKCALRRMRSQRPSGGVIVFVSSIVGKRGAPYASAYSASKGALDGFAEALRAELWGSGIHVATIYPPSIDTPIYDNARSKMPTRPKPAPPVRHAEGIARRIVHLAERPRPETLYGWFRYVYLGAQRLSPSLSDWFLHETAGFTRSQEPTGPDNLFEPSPAPAAVSAGLSKPGIAGFTFGEIARVMPRATVLAIGLAAGLVVTLAARESARRLGRG